MQKSKLQPYSCFKDERGSFIGLVNEQNWKEVNFVKTEKDAHRGGHFHKFTHEIIFIIHGQVQVKLTNVANPKEIVEFTLKEGEGVRIFPNILHDLFYLENSEQIALLDRPFDSNNPDLHTI
ncbi:MAG: WxcM-like domain-containing protein [Thiomargarita sp.]|nr:WxcM-like domain-containing protein [Thiomargarita sp.]